MEQFLNKLCKIEVYIDEQRLFFTGKVINVTPTHISFLDKFGGNYCYKLDVIESIRERNGWQKLQEGTLERFDIDANEIEPKRTAEIFEAMKKTKMTLEDRQELGQRQSILLNKIIEILNKIGAGYNIKGKIKIYNKNTVYIVDDYYHEIIDKLSKQVQGSFAIDKERGQFTYSMQVRNLNLICKYATRIALVRGKKSVSKLELEEAYNSVMESMGNLIDKLELFEKDAGLQKCFR